jgi:hypothetical protein
MASARRRSGLAHIVDGVGQDLVEAAIDHVERDIEDDRKADIGDPAVLLLSRLAMKLAAMPISAIESAGR